MTITADLAPARGPMGPLALRLGQLAIALTFLSSFYVKFEPAICDLLFFLSLPFFYRGGLRLSRAIMPLFGVLLFYNLAGLMAYAFLDYDAFNSWQYVFIGFYMSFSAVFYAAYVAADPEARFQFIMKNYFWGAAIAATMGLLAYFHVLPSSLQFIQFGGRIVGGFKDPNVFSTYLVLPAVVMLQWLLLGKARLSLLNLAGLLAILMAIVLAFSRGAWIDFSLAGLLMIGLTTLLTPDDRQRGALTFKAVVAIALLLLVLAALLTIKETAQLFWDRFTLLKEYDAGEVGRFGNQKNAIPMLLVRPLGFGPLQYTLYFREAPHNAFVNSFASFGWLGGIGYITIVVMNVFAGLRVAFAPTPFQASAIAVFCTLTVMTFQSVQIDSEHWRHMYWMMGLQWGLFAAMAARKGGLWTAESRYRGWNIQQH